MKFDKIKIIKIVSLVASVAGMVGSAWANDKESKIALENLVSQRLGK